MLKRIIPLAAVLLSACFSVRVHAQECQPQPDYWFAEVYQLVLPDELPATLTITPSPKVVAHGYLTIVNHGDAPLYVLAASSLGELIVTAEAALPDEGLSGELTPEAILQAARAPALAAYVVETGASLRLDSTSLTTLIPHIEQRNVRDITRPGFVILPITQRGQFLLVYEDQLFTVGVTISYALNESFAPQACGHTAQPPAAIEIPNKGAATHTLSGMVTLVLLALTVWAAAKRT